MAASSPEDVAIRRMDGLQRLAVLGTKRKKAEGELEKVFEEGSSEDAVEAAIQAQGRAAAAYDAELELLRSTGRYSDWELSGAGIGRYDTDDVQFEVVATLSDGNCFYCSVLGALEPALAGDEQHAAIAKLRGDVVQHALDDDNAQSRSFYSDEVQTALRQNDAEYERTVEEARSRRDAVKYQIYMAALDEDAAGPVWADHIAIQAVSDLVAHGFVIVDKKTGLVRRCIKPRWFEGDPDMPFIILAYTPEVHYELVNLLFTIRDAETGQRVGAAVRPVSTMDDLARLGLFMESAGHQCPGAIRLQRAPA